MIGRSRPDSRIYFLQRQAPTWEIRKITPAHASTCMHSLYEMCSEEACIIVLIYMRSSEQQRYCSFHSRLIPSSSLQLLSMSLQLQHGSPACKVWHTKRAKSAPLSICVTERPDPAPAMCSRPAPCDARGIELVFQQASLYVCWTFNKRSSTSCNTTS